MKSDEVLHHLADCIEGFVQNSESPTNSFVYKNLDLSHAIQRQLFVKLSNNELIMDLVRRIESRDIGVKKSGLNCIENRFIDYIEGQNEVGKKQSSLRVAGSIKSIAKNFHLFAKNKLFKILFHRHALNKSSSNKVIFANIDTKHIRYSLPIAKKIGKNKCLYLSLCNDFQQFKVCSSLQLNIIAPDRSLVLSGELNFDKSHYLYNVFRDLALYVDAYLDLLKKKNPKVIIFTEGSSALEDILSRAAMSLSIPTIRVQYGRAGVLYNGYREMVFSKMLMWGEGFISRLKEISPYPEYIVTGPHILDCEDEAATDLRRELGVLNDKRKGVLIATQPICSTIGYGDYSKLISVAEFFFKQSDKYILFIRKHQVDSDKRLEKLCLKHPQDIYITDATNYSLQSVLKECKYVVGFYSTVLSESIAVGVIPIIVPLENTNSVFPCPDKEGAALRYDNVLDLDEDFGTEIDVTENEELLGKMESFKNKYFYKMDGNSLDRVCDEIFNVYLKNN